MTAKARVTVENPWTDGHDWDPSAYEPSGITGRWVRCLQPQSRTGVVYMAPPYDVAAPPDGEVFHGIGCAWRETGIAAPRVSLIWAGHHTSPHLEVAPLCHVVPGTATHAIGCWTSTLFGSQVIYVGTIGNPPELFNEQLLDIGSFSTTAGRHTTVELRSDGSKVKVFVNGVQVSMGTTGTAGVSIPAELQGSTLHGAAFDTHLTDPEDIPDYDLWTSWSCVPN